MNDFWWPFSIGTIGFLGLCAGLISIVIANQRHRVKQGEERLRAAQENERKVRGLLGEAETMRDQLRRLSRMMLRIQEEERKHISRELHDEVGQLLGAISLNLEMLGNGKYGSGEAEYQRLAGETQGLVQKVFEHIRLFLQDLRPTAVDSAGLIAAVRMLVTEFMRRNPVIVDFSADPAVELLDVDRKMVVYRIIQESLTNISKHARAKCVGITLTSRDQRIQIMIRDDGIGFDVASTLDRPPAPGAGGLGLVGMRERVGLVHGTVKIASHPGDGTTITIEFPLEK